MWTPVHVLCIWRAVLIRILLLIRYCRPFVSPKTLLADLDSSYNRLYSPVIELKHRTLQIETYHFVRYYWFGIWQYTWNLSKVHFPTWKTNKLKSIFDILLRSIYQILDILCHVSPIKRISASFLLRKMKTLS